MTAERTLVCLPTESLLPEPVGADVFRRSRTWGVNSGRVRVGLVLDMIRLMHRARSYERVVISTGGWEVSVACLLKGRRRLVLADWLGPTNHLPGLGRALRRVDEFVVIRRADAAVLAERFGVPRERCRFVPFPAPRGGEADTPSEFWYSAGWAHRDWATLGAALAIARVPAVISCGEDVAFPPNVQRVAQLSTEEGRKRLSRARGVVLTFRPTHLPSGPVVLLDAMANGKAIVATDVAGTRDYLVHGESGLLVPPGDPRAVAEAVLALDADPARREELGRNAREAARAFSAERYWQACLAREGADGQEPPASSTRATTQPMPATGAGSDARQL